MVQTDPITVATTWHFLQRVCRDMRETMERTATNVLTTSLHDLGYGIWDAEGRAIAIPEGFPCRLISSTFTIKAVLTRFGEQIYPGDEFLTNHPFLAGAAHLPDWVFIRRYSIRMSWCFSVVWVPMSRTTGGLRLAPISLPTMLLRRALIFRQ